MDAPSPGSVLREALADQDRSFGWLAKQLGVSRMGAWRLAHDQKRVSARVAVGLSKAIDRTTAEDWMALQMKFDLESTKQEAVS
jgi:addiction module HigA family antidote